MIQARPEATTAAPFFASLSVTTSIRLSSESPIRPATNPTVIMFSRPPGMSLALSFISQVSITTPMSVTTFGTAPDAGSATTIPPSATGMSPMNRSAFFQSIATRISKSLLMHSAGLVASRTRAAASPPRICGPTERFSKPYQPHRPAASSRIDPAVIAPAPPVPTIANETLSKLAIVTFPICLGPFRFNY